MDNQDQKSSGAVEAPEKANGRRRFVRGVGIALPVVMTVKSRSVMATGAQCLAPSATASIALLHSRPGRTTEFCSGRTPGFWGQAWNTHPLIWASVGGEGLLFSNPYTGGFPGQTHKQVMNLNGVGDPYQFGAHMSAAYFNWKKGWVPTTVLDLSDLLAMWNGRNGSYSPTPGVTWGAQQIVAYLQSTMPL